MMTPDQERDTTARTSYWQVFRVIFVLFSLYLMGDAFYRWNGFRFHSPFSEFLPGVALITILWSIVAAVTSLLIWLPGRAWEWFCQRVGWKVKIEHLLLFICIFAVLGATVWFGKRVRWQHTQITSQLEIIIFFSLIFASIFLTWLFRNKMVVIQERITPLVWLFGILVVLSVPLVAYQTWGKQTSNMVSQKSFPSSVTDKNQPNIILVTFDALTARDMSVYGYYRPTTPFISQWAKAASLFTRAKAESNFTTASTTTLMNGKRLWTHQRYHLWGSKPLIESLPLMLKNNGYYNMAFIVNRYASVRKLGISESFEIADPPIAFYTSSKGLYRIIRASLSRLFGDIQLHDWLVREDFVFYKLVATFSQDFSETIVPPEKAFNKFLEVIDNNVPTPFFAWIHVTPPHDPYLPPEMYMGMFDSSPRLRTYESQRNAPIYKFKPEQEATVDILRARYDEFIRYCDKQFENFIAQLGTRSRLKNSVIILSSDHGMSFEHNFVGHGRYNLYEQETHIPLIIKESNQTEGRIIDDLVGLIDIAPSILELANISAPLWIEGRSLVPLMRGKKLPSHPVFSMNFRKNSSRRYQITKGTIAVWDGDYKLIHYLEKEESLLFNLKQDPDELNNLFDREPEVGQRLLSLIQENLKEANDRIKRIERR
ncbi:MAG TPA: DUF4976 domain-containing protein [Nitrospirae bacterium]|nr:DUF4976 domain-containing protein [Nitrospirota bacterium]HDZ62041.1 DUF4976 domain-containing protein [Nitrospirota bacterium]